MAGNNLVVLVCGGRGWSDRWLVHEELRKLRCAGYGVVIHGAARGADRIAGEEARLLGFAVREFPARWDIYGKGAGVLRNQEMIDQGPDLVLAFHEDLRASRGTVHTLRLAREHGIPARAINRDNPGPSAFFGKKASKETLIQGGVA
jgi:hypothetical protein